MPVYVRKYATYEDVDYVHQLKYTIGSHSARCVLPDQVLADIYVDVPLQSVSSQYKPTKKITFSKGNWSAESSYPVSHQFARAMNSLGLHYSIEETTSMSKSTGGHDYLRSVADKMQCKMLNCARLDDSDIIIDVGSKFKSFNTVVLNNLKRKKEV